MGRMSPTFATVGVNNVLWLRSLRLPNSDLGLRWATRWMTVNVYIIFKASPILHNGDVILRLDEHSGN